MYVDKVSVVTRSLRTSTVANCWGITLIDLASPDPRSVFVVHGRNLQARDAMFAFLRREVCDPLGA